MSRKPQPLPSTPRTEPVALRVRRIASRQEGVITRRQLREAGLSDTKIARWLAEGHLSRRQRTIYTLGHDAISQRGELVIALFYAGPGSALSYMTAAWWWGLLVDEPRRIHVSATHNRVSTPDIKVHRPRSLEPVIHRGLPVTAVPQTILESAAGLSFGTVRKVIAEAEFRRLAAVTELEAALGQGRPGARVLRRALASHQPQLARTRSPLEERFLHFCERHGIPIPRFNHEIAGLTVDAAWLDDRLVVELDSRSAHATPARMEEDRRRDLVLRASGFDVWRYTGKQLAGSPSLVAAELKARLR